METPEIDQEEYMSLLQKVEERLKEHVFEYKKLLLLFNTGTILISFHVLSLTETPLTKCQNILLICCWLFSMIPLFVALAITLLEVNGHRKMFRNLLDKKAPTASISVNEAPTLFLSNISLILTVLACLSLFLLSLTLITT